MKMGLTQFYLTHFAAPHIHPTSFVLNKNFHFLKSKENNNWMKEEEKQQQQQEYQIKTNIPIPIFDVCFFLVFFFVSMCKLSMFRSTRSKKK